MENLDLTQILKDCPKGTKLYSPIFGEVEFVRIDTNSEYSVSVKICAGGCTEYFTSDGKFYNNKVGECMLFPSKDQRDWSKFKVPREDLPIDTPVLTTDDTWKYWSLRYYAGNGKTWINQLKSADETSVAEWKYIVPFDKFDPNDIEGSVKKYNYGTKQD